MDQKSFEKITVDDIAKETMINRSTFYQHFADKYAILENNTETQSYTELLMSSYKNMSMAFYRMDNNKETSNAFDVLISKYAMSERSQAITDNI